MREPASNEATYVFDAAWSEERARLRALETVWDPYTCENFDRLGMDLSGRRCLEVGAGNGSIAGWLCERVGPAGSAVATDVNARFLESMRTPNLEVRRHDIVSERLEPASFDLVHARLLLEHLPQRKAALQHMVEALKPGGWLLLEEFDHISLLPDPASDDAAQAVWSQFTAALERLAEQRGLDLVYGRRMFGLLRAAGLEDVHAEGRTFAERGGADDRALLRLSLESGFGDGLAGTGLIDRHGVDHLMALLKDPDFCWTSQIMVAAKGRQPR